MQTKASQYLLVTVHYWHSIYIIILIQPKAYWKILDIKKG